MNTNLFSHRTAIVCPSAVRPRGRLLPTRRRRGKSRRGRRARGGRLKSSGRTKEKTKKAEDAIQQAEKKATTKNTPPTSTSLTVRVLHYSSKKTATKDSDSDSDSDSSEDTPAALEPAVMDSEDQRASFLNRKYSVEDHVGQSRAEERAWVKAALADTERHVTCLWQQLKAATRGRPPRSDFVARTKNPAPKVAGAVELRGVFTRVFTRVSYSSDNVNIYLLPKIQGFPQGNRTFGGKVDTGGNYMTAHTQKT